MKPWTLRPIDPKSDFARLAEWFTYLENSVNTEDGLNKYYDREKSRISHLGVLDPKGDLAGFYWVERDHIAADRSQFSMYVMPEYRRQGLGSRLYAKMLDGIRQSGGKTLQASVRDDCPDGLGFVSRRGFHEVSHHLAMSLDLAAIDDRPYDALIERLEAEGFIFTSMEELGNTEAAQRKLYALNDTAAAETMGARGEHPWESFEDFQKRVCESEWYVPAGQMVVIDTASGDWAAMSAITQFAGADYAYNLFTGVDSSYRGRKLGQAVKIKALRFARDVLRVGSVHTHHNSKNLPILAIDRKLGYTQIPGYYLMEKKVRD